MEPRDTGDTREQGTEHNANAPSPPRFKSNSACKGLQQPPGQLSQGKLGIDGQAEEHLRSSAPRHRQSPQPLLTRPRSSHQAQHHGTALLHQGKAPGARGGHRRRFTADRALRGITAQEGVGLNVYGLERAGRKQKLEDVRATPRFKSL